MRLAAENQTAIASEPMGEFGNLAPLRKAIRMAGFRE